MAIKQKEMVNKQPVAKQAFVDLNEETYFQAMVESASDLIVLIDDNGKLMYVSPSLTDRLGFSMKELETETIFTLIHPKDSHHVQHELTNLTIDHQPKRLEYRLQSIHGETIHVEASFNILRHTTTHIMTIMRDITNRLKTEEIYRHLAYHDALTDLPNRLYFMECLEQEIESARQHGKKFAVIFLDVDNFKEVNDTMGHMTGDFVLTEAGYRLKQAVRKQDIVARIGGDEFTVLLPQITGEEEAVSVVKAIQNKFKKPILTNCNMYHLSFSIGISIFPQDAKTATDVLTKADHALYKVKASGRNGYALYAESK